MMGHYVTHAQIHRQGDWGWSSNLKIFEHVEIRQVDQSRQKKVKQTTIERHTLLEIAALFSPILVSWFQTTDWKHLATSVSQNTSVMRMMRGLRYFQFCFSKQVTASISTLMLSYWTFWGKTIPLLGWEPIHSLLRLRPAMEHVTQTRTDTWSAAGLPVVPQLRLAARRSHQVRLVPAITAPA